MKNPLKKTKKVVEEDIKILEVVIDPNYMADEEGNVIPLDSVIEELDEAIKDNSKHSYYKGKFVVTDGIRTVNDKEYKFLVLEDGTIHDLTDADYKEYLELNK